MRAVLSDEQMLDKDCESVFDSIKSKININRRYEKLHKNATDFSLMFVEFFLSQLVDILQKHAADLREV